VIISPFSFLFLSILTISTPSAPSDIPPPISLLQYPSSNIPPPISLLQYPSSNPTPAPLPIPLSPSLLPMTRVLYYRLFLVIPDCILYSLMFLSFSACY